MGTRNLTVVIHKGHHRVAQYGQWDGYPSGQGKTVVEFIKNNLDTPKKLSAFRKAIEKTVFISPEEAEDRINEFMRKHDYNQLNKEFPNLSRNTAAEILNYINSHKGDVIELEDVIDFANDGLFCEWMYVLDLDKKLLKVYRGIYKDDGVPSVEYPSQEHVKTYKFSAIRDVNKIITDMVK